MTASDTSVAPDGVPSEGKRPIRRRTDARRALVIAAGELLGTLQPSAIGGRSIAARAGVSYGLISYYWPDGGAMGCLAEAFAELQRAWVAEFTPDIEAWLHSPSAGAFFRALTTSTGDREFAGLVGRLEHGGPGFEQFASTLPDASRAEAAAAWLSVLRFRAAAETLPTAPVRSLISDLVLDELSTVDRLRAERLVSGQLRRWIRGLLRR